MNELMTVDRLREDEDSFVRAIIESKRSSRRPSRGEISARSSSSSRCSPRPTRTSRRGNTTPRPRGPIRSFDKRSAGPELSSRRASAEAQESELNDPVGFDRKLHCEECRSRHDGELARRKQVHRRLRYPCHQHPARQRVGDRCVAGDGRHQDHCGEHRQVLVAVRMGSAEPLHECRPLFACRLERVGSELSRDNESATKKKKPDGQQQKPRCKSN